MKPLYYDNETPAGREKPTPPDLSNGGGDPRRDVNRKAKWEKRNRMVLRYDTIDNGNRVILSGVNERNDSVYIVLERADKNFALTESSLQAGKY
jgi:hypothetical protein